ncbi:MAG: hypothetical protein RJA70_3364, partial [Pseudomonadota bacterium]
MSSLPDTRADAQPVCLAGRYALYGKLATGGMATVHFGRLIGPVGFTRTVAVKRLHPEFAKDPQFVTMFLDEARVAARIQHPNVVATIDIVSTDDELFLVMDYVRGESLSRLLRVARRKGLRVPEGFAVGVIAGMLHGLHAAHEATDERGQPLKVVHRDVSPQNVLVGVDGVARVLDFGVAKAAARVQVTRAGQMKGKLGYMSPEQLQGQTVDRRSDVFAAGVVLWEALTGERLFVGDEVRDVLKKIVSEPTRPPSQWNPNVSPELDALVLRALNKHPDLRYQTAREFGIALESAVPLLSVRETGEWVEEIAGDTLEKREAALAEIESISSVGDVLSDPEFMRTLSRTLPGGPVAALAPSSPRLGSPPPPKPSAQSTSRRRVAPPPLPGLPPLGGTHQRPNDVAPRNPDSRPGAVSRPGSRPPGRALGEIIGEMDPFADDTPTPPTGGRLLVEVPDEPTLIYDPMNIGDVTSPKHRSSAPPARVPPRTPPVEPLRRYYVAGAVLFGSAVLSLSIARWVSQPAPDPLSGYPLATVSLTSLPMGVEPGTQGLPAAGGEPHPDAPVNSVNSASTGEGANQQVGRSDAPPSAKSTPTEPNPSTRRTPRASTDPGGS